MKNAFPDNFIQIVFFCCLVPSTKEYCSFENFHPVCARTEIILMSSAIYGRMAEGRCLELDSERKLTVKQDSKYFGCSDDVLEWMDRKCSGKMECNVRIYDQELRQKSSCYKDIDKYLEASYSCVTGDLKLIFSYLSALAFFPNKGILIKLYNYLIKY